MYKKKYLKYKKKYLELKNNKEGGMLNTLRDVVAATTGMV